MTTKPLVSIIILNWNGIAETLQCLDSVSALTYPNYEVIVVDNGSVDGSPERLKKVSSIKLVCLPKNTGFTGGHIEGLKHASGNYIALLNNDLVVAPDWLTKLVQCAQKNNADIVGGRSYEWDESQAPYNTSNRYSSYQTVSPITGHTVMLKQGEHTTEANNLSGSNLLVNRRVVEAIGYLDNSFFAYYEETDFIARAKRAGYIAAYCPAAHVWHKSGVSSKSIPFFYYYHMHRNRFRFAFKNYDPPELRRFLRYYTSEMLLAAKHSARKRNLHDTALVKAYFANAIALPSLLAKRRQVRKLGETYTKKLTTGSEGFDDVTIVVPCYNYQNFVEETLDSIEAQTLRPYEVIIINDGSTDDSANIIKAYIDNHADSPIKYRLINKDNEGVIATKNLALTEVHTNWLLFLDADDVLDPQYLEKTVHTARHEDSDIVYTDMEMFGSVNTTHKVTGYNKYLLRSTNFIHNSALMKTAIFKQVGGYKPLMSIGFEDWELYLSISEVTERFSYIPEPLLKYRRHDGASRDILAQNKLPTVVKYLEELHPQLYNLWFYYWLESYRIKNSLLDIAKYPFRLARHTKSHAVKHVRNNPNNKVGHLALRAHKKLRKRSPPNA